MIRCEGTQKRSYLTRVAAKQYAKQRMKATRGLKLFVYACGHCDGWHLTRMDRTQFVTMAKVTGRIA